VLHIVTYVGAHYFVMLEYFDGCYTDSHTVYTIHIHIHYTCTYSTSVIEQEGHLMGGHTTMHYSTVHSSMKVVLLINEVIKYTLAVFGTYLT